MLAPAKHYKLIPQGGLCNRMRTLDAALALAADTGRELVVQWDLDPGLNCHFEDLFEVPPGIAEINTRDYTGRFSKQRKTLAKRLNRLRYGRCLYERDLARYTQNHALTDLSSEASVLIASCQRFYDRPPYYTTLRPTAANRARIDALTQRFAPPMLGIHIRRTDHVHAIANSPTELFVTEMKQALAQQPDTHFFVATDCPDTERELAAQFPDRVINHPKSSLDRGDAQAIQDALVDVYGLAACDGLLGSVQSSFSQTAAQIGGIELTIVDARHAAAG